MSTAVSVNFDDSLSTRDFRQLASFIYNYCGIKMPETKRSMLEGRLRKRLRATGHATFGSYCDYLFSDGGLQDEAIFLIDVVTTNKTDFFREPSHFDYMEKRPCLRWRNEASAVFVPGVPPARRVPNPIRWRW